MMGMRSLQPGTLLCVWLCWCGAGLAQAHAQAQVPQPEIQHWFITDAPFVSSREATQFVRDEALFTGQAARETALRLLSEAAAESEALAREITTALRVREPTPREVEDQCALWYERTRQIDAAFMEHMQPLLGDAADQLLRLQQRHAMTKALALTETPGRPEGNPFDYLRHAAELCASSGDHENPAIDADAIAEPFLRRWMQLAETILRDYAPDFVYIVSTRETTGTGKAYPGASRNDARDAFIAQRDASIVALGDALERAGCTGARMAALCHLFPQACHATPTDIAMEMLGHVDWLPERQVALLQSIYDSYRAQRDALRTVFLEAHVQWMQPATKAQRDREIQKRREAREPWNDLLERHPGRPLLRRLFHLERGAIHDLRAVLTGQNWQQCSIALQLALTWPVTEE